MKKGSYLIEFTGEIVSAAEGFAERVIYIPVSATGGAPEEDPETIDAKTQMKLLGFRPSRVKPIWTEVPLLYAFARWTGGMVARAK